MTQTPDMPRHLSLGESARWYGVHERTMRRMIADGKLPAYRVGKQIRIKVEDLEALATKIPTAG